MARLACVPSGLRSAAGFPQETIIPQRPPPDEDGSGVLAGRCVLYPPHSTPLLSPDASVCEWEGVMRNLLCGALQGARRDLQDFREADSADTKLAFVGWLRSKA